MMFLPGVPAVAVRAAFSLAPGNEIASGKFAHPDSSAALAANGIGWFLDSVARLPCFPGLGDLDWPATTLALEQEVRFPWNGGRHAWLDAVATSPNHLIGIESKRLEPFRDAKRAVFSATYDRIDWGRSMAAWTVARDRLRAEPLLFRHLDAAQLIKHAFALVTEGRRQGRAPVLVYLYAEPPVVDPAAISRHRNEVAAFEAMVAEGEVRFAPCRWNDWLATFTGEAAEHAVRVRDAFRL